MGYLVFVYPQYLATQPVHLLPAVDCVRARVCARVAPFCVTMGPTDARTPFFLPVPLLRRSSHSHSFFRRPLTHSIIRIDQMLNVAENNARKRKEEEGRSRLHVREMMPLIEEALELLRFARKWIAK